MTFKSRLSEFSQRPIKKLKAYWCHGFYWNIQKSMFERRHFRRLFPIILFLTTLTILWCSIVLLVTLALGGHGLIFHPGFIQNIIASLIVLPIGLAIGVVVGTLLQKHSLRFQARHAGDNLGDCVGLEIFKFILFLKNECKVQIDLEGPVDHIFIQKAREKAIQHFSSNCYKSDLPDNFINQLYEAVTSVSDCFNKSIDLRLAFPQSFDLFDRLKATIEDIKKGSSQSSPENTTLIVLYFVSQILEDLK